MPTTAWNKTKVPVGSDPYNLTSSLLDFAKSINVAVFVSSEAERNAIAWPTPNGSPQVGSAVIRTDLSGLKQTYDGSKWLGERRIIVAGATSVSPIDMFGTVSVNTDVNGAAAYTFPTPFPNAQFGAIINKTYQDEYGLASFQFDEDLSTKARVAFRCYDSSGQPLRSSAGVRVTYHAWGQ